MSWVWEPNPGGPRIHMCIPAIPLTLSIQGTEGGVVGSGAEARVPAERREAPAAAAAHKWCTAEPPDSPDTDSGVAVSDSP